MRKLFVAAVLLLVSGCRLIILAPDTALVESQSGAHSCPAGNDCQIDVSDFFFNETFVAKPEDGFYFDSWQRFPGGLCGGQTGPCELDSSELEGNPLLEAILFSDTAFYLAPNIRPGFIYESRDCSEVPQTSPLNQRDAERTINGVFEQVSHCTYIADNRNPLPNEFGFDIRNILLYRISEFGELSAPNDFVYVFDLAADTEQNARNAWPVVYLDIDANVNTGRPVRGLGAEYRLHYNFNCVRGRSGLYEWDDVLGWQYIEGGSSNGVAPIGDGRYLLYGIILKSAFLAEHVGKQVPEGVLTLEQFEGDCSIQGDYLEASTAFSISNYYD